MKHGGRLVRFVTLLGVPLFLATSLLAQAPADMPVPALTTLVDGPSGRIAFKTLTLTSTQSLNGAKKGKKSLIWGELRLPPVVTWGEFHLPNEYLERRPAVILLHGEDGLSAREAHWAALLNEMGVPTFVLDSFTGRGFSHPFDPASTPGQEAMIVDAYRALALLSTHSRIDRTRIALMGFSRGGAAALYASHLRFRRIYGLADVEFTAYLAFYPACNTAYLPDEQVSDRPIRIFHGADDIASLAACRGYIDRLRSAGKDVQLQAVEAVKAVLTATFKLPPESR
ncbi:MAG: dienelactone hydrolase family protein [Candidatus Entotheonellia bacterium]